MALWYCTNCTAAYAVGLDKCPQCGYDEFDDEVAHMAKISESGPTHTPGEEPEEWTPPATEEAPSDNQAQASADEPEPESEAAGEADDKSEVAPEKQDAEAIRQDQPVIITPASDEKSETKGTKSEKS